VKERELSVIGWEVHDAWVGVFDFLGFKERARRADDEFHREWLTLGLRELISFIESSVDKLGKIHFQQISDTLVFYSPDLSTGGYGNFLGLCQHLAYKAINARLPLRGAISSGTLIAEQNRPIILGPAFVEAYEYCEGQDWVGLLMAPSATKRLRDNHLEPLHHHFVADDAIPLKGNVSPENVLAYRFQDGATNFDNPLLPVLEEMKAQAPDNAKHKHHQTIDFIKRHHQYTPHKKAAP